MAIKQIAFSDKMKNERTRIYLPELLTEVNSYDNDDKRIEVIKQYIKKSQENRDLLRDYLQCIYHPSVILKLPDSIPPYDNTQYLDYDMAPTTLKNALKRIKYFVESHSAFIKDTLKRENVFIQTLEGMHAKDAELYTCILLKKFPIEVYSNLGMSVFSKACPEFLPESVIPIDDIIKAEKDELTKIKKTLTKAKK